MLTLEKYKGSASRHTCPACGRAKKFSRYIDSETGRYIADNVGRCDRESSCGYHYTPKEYFAHNHIGRNVYKMSSFQGIPKQAAINKNGSQANCEGRFSIKKPDYLDNGHLLDILTDYGQNAFVQFLLGLFPFDAEDVNQAVKDYLIGTKDGFTVFPTISNAGKFCKAKLMKFDPETGKRLKEDYSISSLQSKMKKSGDLKEDFEADKEVFFGEHLLRKYPGLPIAIVEAEKSAVLGSICKGVFPDLVWLACGSGGWLNAERIRRIGRNETIMLFPDADEKGYWFAKWQLIASEASKPALSVKVSDLIEKRATDAEKANGFDLADYLIRLQLKRNDPVIRQAFADQIGERLAIMIKDGGLTLEQAEDAILASGYYDCAIRRVLHDFDDRLCKIMTDI